MTTLITGGSGFIGSHLNADINLDIKDSNDVLECELPDADVIIHLAAEPGVVASVADPLSNARTNILGTIRLLERYPEAKFIFASSGGTIQETIESPYGLSKYTCEEYIKMLHPDNYVILRLPNVYGLGSRSVVDKFLNEDELTIYGDGLSYRIYGYVGDVVRAIVQSLDWPSGTYSLGTKQRYNVLQLAQAMEKSYHFEPARRGEITHAHSQLPNTTPDWEAEVELTDYIRGTTKP